MHAQTSNMERQHIFRDRADVSGLLTLATTVDSILQNRTAAMPSIIKQSSSCTSTLSESLQSFDSNDTPCSHVQQYDQDKICRASFKEKKSGESLSPPVTEIQIHPNHPRRCSASTTLPSAPFGLQLDSVDYETKYFCGQRDLHILRERMFDVCEENRLLRRQLIELQKQIFHNLRTKRRVVEVNSAWSVPESSPTLQRYPKRQRTTATSRVDSYTRVIDHTDHDNISSNQPKGAKEACSSPFSNTSCDAVISTVTSEELSVSSSKE
jgi:hypothetical protein